MCAKQRWGPQTIYAKLWNKLLGLLKVLGMLGVLRFASLRFFSLRANCKGCKREETPWHMPISLVEGGPHREEEGGGVGGGGGVGLSRLEKRDGPVKLKILGPPGAAQSLE